MPTRLRPTRSGRSPRQGERPHDGGDRAYPGEGISRILARDHIVTAKSLGGSYLPDSVIADRSAALFEYRNPLGFPEAFGHAFWDKDESFL